VPRSPYEWVPPGRSPHSTHVAILVGLGIVGFVVWIGLFAAALRYVWIAWRKEGNTTSEQVLLAQAVGMAVVLQFFYGFYAEVHLEKIIWLIFGLSVAIHRLAAVPTSQTGLPRPTSKGVGHRTPSHASSGLRGIGTGQREGS